MASLARKAMQLQQKKLEAAKLKRKGKRELKKAQSMTQRSISGLASLQRRIESSKDL